MIALFGNNREQSLPSFSFGSSATLPVLSVLIMTDVVTSFVILAWAPIAYPPYPLPPLIFPCILPCADAETPYASIPCYSSIIPIDFPITALILSHCKEHFFCIWWFSEWIINFVSLWHDTKAVISGDTPLSEFELYLFSLQTASISSRHSYFLLKPKEM